MNSNAVKTLIIEHPSRSLISNALASVSRHGLKVLPIESSCRGGIDAIQSLKPELVLLETELPDGNGFSVLEKTRDLEFKLIVCSQNAKNTFKAFRYDADVFLLGPLDPAVTQSALDKLHFRNQDDGLEKRFNRLFNTPDAVNIEWLAIRSKKGLHFWETTSITRFHQDPKGTIFHHENGETLLSRKPFLNFKKMLSPLGFSTVRPGLTVNSFHIVDAIPGIPDRILLSDGTEVACDLSRVHNFISRF